MIRKKTLMIGLSITGSLILAYGLFHNLATSMIIHQFESLSARNTGAFLFMFLFTGSSNMLMGFLTITLSKRVDNAFPVAVIALFLVLGASGAILAMEHSFYAYLFLIIALINLVLAFLFMKND